MPLRSSRPSVSSVLSVLQWFYFSQQPLRLPERDLGPVGRAVTLSPLATRLGVAADFRQVARVQPFGLAQGKRHLGQGV